MTLSPQHRAALCISRSLVEMVLSFLIFYFSGYEFSGLSLLKSLAFYNESGRVRKKLPLIKKVILGKSLTLFINNYNFIPK
jgi:hypothetical protein